MQQLIAATLVAFICFVKSVSAQEYPVRPITLLVGLAPGGVTDVIGRIYAAAATAKLGQNIIVENRPASSGAIAAAALQKAQPDGYTLLIYQDHNMPPFRRSK